MKRKCSYCGRPLADNSTYAACVVCRAKRQNKFRPKKLERPVCIEISKARALYEAEYKK